MLLVVSEGVFFLFILIILTDQNADTTLKGVQ